jgi:hypothetical protein
VVEEMGDGSDGSSAFHVPQKFVYINHIITVKSPSIDDVGIGDRHQDGALNAAGAH